MNIQVMTPTLYPTLIPITRARLIDFEPGKRSGALLQFWTSSQHCFLYLPPVGGKLKLATVDLDNHYSKDHAVNTWKLLSQITTEDGGMYYEFEQVP